MALLADIEDSARNAQSSVARWLFDVWQTTAPAGQLYAGATAAAGAAPSLGTVLEGATGGINETIRESARRAAETAQWLAIAVIVVAGVIALAVIALFLVWVRAQVTLGKEAIGAVKENPEIVAAVA